MLPVYGLTHIMFAAVFSVLQSLVVLGEKTSHNYIEGGMRGLSGGHEIVEK